ncbi:protein rolling stone-like [Branchiostoma floridae]|uniref:Protein rolling stone-like n=1 Tax=Branchiostoma floridae TaxID=7739 RepID=A0A9J7MQK3_BRAFL|nr:protein rolling stone-like [Branchiostoma floridae]
MRTTSIPQGPVRGWREACSLAWPNYSSFVTSPWSSDRWPFVVYRVVCALITLSILLYSIPTDSNRWITFYTNWAYTAFTLHFCWSAAVCVLDYRNAAENRRGKLMGGPPAKMALKIGWVIYNVAMSNAFMVSAEYWLSPFPVTFGFRSFLRHGLNSIMAVTDIIVSGIPSRLGHVVHTVLFATIYNSFLVLYWLLDCRGYDGKPYVYSFADFNTVPLQAFVILAGSNFIILPAAHGLVCLLYQIRLVLLGNFKERKARRVIELTPWQKRILPIEVNEDMIMDISSFTDEQIV